MPYELFIGGRYLRAKRKEAFISLTTVISVGGVALGVMALIVVIAVMTGFEADLKERILGITSHVTVMQYGGRLSEYEDITRVVEKIPGVTGATPYVQAQVMIRSASGTTGAMLKGIDPDSADRTQNISRHVKSGALEDLQSGSENKTPGLMLGAELASRLGVMSGDSVYIISPKGTLSPMGHVPAMRRFFVVGVFESGMYEYDAALAWADLVQVQKVMRMPDSVTGIEVSVEDIYQADQVALDIKKTVGFPYWCRDWMQSNRNLLAALKLEKVTMFIILALIVLVAAFNIASTLIMMVMEKRREIAILKAMGASAKSIRKIFVYNGMIIGGLGTLLGVCAGSILCSLLSHYQFIELPPDVYYISTLPVSMQLWDVLGISTAALIICLLATLYPAWHAARLDPVEIIRYG